MSVFKSPDTHEPLKKISWVYPLHSQKVVRELHESESDLSRVKKRTIVSKLHELRATGAWYLVTVLNQNIQLA